MKVYDLRGICEKINVKNAKPQKLHLTTLYKHVQYIQYHIRWFPLNKRKVCVAIPIASHEMVKGFMKLWPSMLQDAGWWLVKIQIGIN